MKSADVIIVGAGAAGLMAAIWAGRSARARGIQRRIVLLEGAKRVGAKILVAGGGRCNVTNVQVSAEDFAGSTQPAIRNVLRRFDAAQTREFFADLGVELKEEPLGKLFPVTDHAQTVLDALLREVRYVGIELLESHRVESIKGDEHGAGFTVAGAWGETQSPRIIIATGGRALPKSGSDGTGYEFMRSLGVCVTKRLFPALVPLILAKDHFVRQLPGVSVPDAMITLRRSAGRIERTFQGAVLCTHFGLSGPAVMNMSRYLTQQRFRDRDAQIEINWLGVASPKDVDTNIIHGGAKRPSQLLQGRLPERLLCAILDSVPCDPSVSCAQLTRQTRQRLVNALTAMRMPITGDRGYTFAEATAGGVPLAEMHLKTLEARACPGLHLCGEICDVDGHIGGFNFQWAWSSGYVAGVSVSRPD